MVNVKQSHWITLFQNLAET